MDFISSNDRTEVSVICQRKSVHQRLDRQVFAGHEIYLIGTVFSGYLFCVDCRRKGVMISFILSFRFVKALVIYPV